MKEEVTLEDLMKFMSEKLATKSDLEDLATKEDVVKLEGKVDQMKETLDGHTEILNGHTRDLNTIKNDIKTNLEKRLQLETRVTKIEQNLIMPTPEQTAV